MLTVPSVVLWRSVLTEVAPEPALLAASDPLTVDRLPSLRDEADAGTFPFHLEEKLLCLSTLPYEILLL